MKTIEATFDSLDKDLRELSLKLHGSYSFLKTSSNCFITLAPAVDNPEIAFEERLDF